MTSSQSSKNRMAGSPEFKQNYFKTTDELRVSQQDKYDKMKSRGYDDLSNLETHQAAQQHRNLKAGGKFERNTIAQQGLKDSKFDYSGDLSGYDSEAQSTRKFDTRDYNFLKSKGATDEAIQAHMGTLGKHQIHESITTNKQFAGNLYRGDMDKSKGIESYDMGKGFNTHDIQYLRSQGYDDKEIADYGLSTGKGFGQGTAKFLQGQGRLDTRAADTFGQLPLQSQGSKQHVPGQISNQPVVDTTVGADSIHDATAKFHESNEANYARSQSIFNAKDRASKASAAAQETVKADDMFKGLRQSVVDTTDYYGAESTKRQAALFGDMWDVTDSPTFKPPSNPNDFMRDYNFGSKRD